MAYHAASAASSAAFTAKSLAEDTNTVKATPTFHPRGSLPGSPNAPISIQGPSIVLGSMEVSCFAHA